MKAAVLYKPNSPRLCRKLSAVGLSQQERVIVF